jgi:hypothetical protein
VQFRSTILFVVMVVLLGVRPGTAGDTRLRIEVVPRIAVAPATIRVRAIVEPNADNRSLQIAADSGDFFRSSMMDMSGADAALITETTIKDLPVGQYDVSVVLYETQGRRIVERRSVTVTGRELN